MNDQSNPTALDSDSSGWPGVLTELLAGVDLSPQRAKWAMEQVMAGSASPAQIGGFLVALQSKGVSGSELATLVQVMLAHAVPVDVPGRSVDTCGTGGDNSGSVNISTMSAVAVAATGRQVVKHGNRAATSQSGSADVLEALGIVVDLSPDLIPACVARAGIAFCFAPVFHPSMRHAGPVRRELGIPTVFNVLGPLANPARPSAQVVGVANAAMAPIVADALQQRGTSAFVVRGEDGLDELTTLGRSRIWDCRGDTVSELTVEPQDVGLSPGRPGVLDGGDAAFNAAVARDALSAHPGESARPVRDAVVLNAAAAVACVDSTAATDAGASLTQLRLAAREVEAALDAGEGAGVLARWAEASQSLARSQRP